MSILKIKDRYYIGFIVLLFIADVLLKVNVHNAYAEVCYECHQDVKNEFDGYEVKHDVIDGVMTFSCGFCHRNINGLPHSINYMNTVRGQIDICLSCHGEELQSSYQHKYDIPKTEYGTEVIVDGLPGAMDTMTCITCHAYHGSNLQYWTWTRYDTGKFCTICHKY